MKVYLAGKISTGDWRSCLDGYRAFSMDAADIVDDENEENENTQLFESFFGELPVISKHPYIEVTGPFFLSCDHSCYHGNNSHGVGAISSKDPEAFHNGEWSGCAGTTFSRNEVAEICTRQICKADMVFAYINSDDCYGTLCEIGYGAGIGKPIAVMFDNSKRAESMWFVRELACDVFTLDNEVFKIDMDTFLDEPIWIANRIAHNFIGKGLWYAPTDTPEESKFNKDYCHLSGKDKYIEYLKTDWWQKVRIERLKIDGFKCANCGTDKNLQVHHTDYSRGWFHEDPRQDLITLCKKCHEKEVHGIDN